MVSVTYEGDARIPDGIVPTYAPDYMRDPALSGDVTFATASGTSQQQGVDLPITRKAGGAGIVVQMPPGGFAYVSIQLKHEYGEVSCRIRGSGGSVISENTSRGAYAVVSCKGAAR